MSKGRILIVEDNQMNMTLMNDILTHYNYETICVDNGEEAIETINNENFDLILLDLQLPKVSGFDVLKNIKKDVKVIIVSACAMEEDVKKALNYNCLDYITKPLHIKDFIGKIEKYVKI